MEPLEAIPNPPVERKPFPWRLFWLLALMMLLASLLLIPYALQLVLSSNPQMAERATVMRITTTVTSVIQAILIYWPIALLGLYIARRLTLGAPYLEALVQGSPSPTRWTRILRPAALIGFGTGVLILLLSALLSPLMSSELARLNASAAASAKMPDALQGFMAAISAGINEEILLRLFLLSLLAWGIQWSITRRSQGRPSLKVLWIANVLAAIAFGLLHTPNLSAMNVPVTPFLLLYLIGLNGIAGPGFGWLYFTYGLESAMLAHFFIDIVLHVLTVPLQGLVK